VDKDGQSVGGGLFRVSEKGSEKKKRAPGKKSSSTGSTVPTLKNSFREVFQKTNRTRVGGMTAREKISNSDDQKLEASDTLLIQAGSCFQDIGRN